MAPQLSAASRVMIKSMLERGISTKDIASAVPCSPRAVQRISKKYFSRMITASRVGRRSVITPFMRETLRDELTKQPDMYQSEILEFLHEKFNTRVSERALGRQLKHLNWTRKTNRRRAQQRDADLRDYYLHRISKYKSYQLVYIDESGCDKRTGLRRWGWSPKGTTPVQVAKFTRGGRYHVLPAYWQGGLMLRQVYQGSTDMAMFDQFIERLLQHCGRFPEPKSVLVMDNASWHYSPKLRQMCAEAGVKLEFLSPYSPDFNPIEEFFSVLKKFIKKHWYRNQDLIKRNFRMYLEWCVDMVGNQKGLAPNHFRHAKVFVQQPPG
ncbi:hypothetical protein HJFPF1_13577 [Paramyrothecium foliicola]|nr:hypothetical protein HJFPF1_13577 [Paramyrothecium foliicola]